MLKISILDTAKQRRLVLEGRLVEPWAAELTIACDQASANLHGRELVIDLNNLMAISHDGENTLLALMNAGIKLRCRSVLAKRVFKQLTVRARTRVQEVAS